jgi:hypothetical protein
MDARPERRPLGGVRHRRDDPRSTGRTAHRQTPMALDPRLDRGQLDRVVFAHGLGRKIGRQPGTAAWAVVRLMVDEAIHIRAHGAAVPVMAWLGATGLGLIPPLLAIGRGRLGGCARGLLRPLQPQHQLDQLFLAQTLKIAAAHGSKESAKSSSRKGLGSYR